eukprot:GFKZ01007720.1.p2 GENE.GFKZ01007720.1~~GFKZ01007720.1.p2  ORF type:complete len:170 (+),score=16.48 GFKZ01007720.1:24-512(+)
MSDPSCDQHVEILKTIPLLSTNLTYFGPFADAKTHCFRFKPSVPPFQRTRLRNDLAQKLQHAYARNGYRLYDLDEYAVAENPSSPHSRRALAGFAAKIVPIDHAMQVQVTDGGSGNAAFFMVRKGVMLMDPDDSQVKVEKNALVRRHQGYKVFTPETGWTYF